MDLRHANNLQNAFLSHLDWGECEPAAAIAYRLCDVLSAIFNEKQGSLGIDKATLDKILNELKTDQTTISNILNFPKECSRLKRLALRFDFYFSVINNRSPNVFFLRCKKLLHKKSFILGLGFLFFAGGVLGFIYKTSTRNNYWLGQYYSDMEFKNLKKERIDPGVNFYWGYSAPILGFQSDRFSVRWTGFLKCDQAGKYFFRFEVNDGVRFWIDDVLLLDEWTTPAPKVKTTNLFLTEGHHKIKVEYFEVDGFAGIRMKWKTPGGIKFTPIPRKNIKSELAL